MIATLTEAECLALTVRASDDLLTGWRGPIQTVSGCDHLWTVVAHEPGRVTVYYPAVGALDSFGADYRMFLPLASPLVQAHLVGWLGQGERCDCRGGYRAPRHSDEICPVCEGCGYTRPPHNRYAWLTPEAHGGLPDWVRMALIWGSVVRVAAGMEPILGVYGPREGVARRLLFGPGWTGAGNGRSFEADHAILSRSEVYIDETPTGRVIRFEVPGAPQVPRYT